MRAGTLRQRIVIEAPVEPTGGEPRPSTWTRFLEAWASIEPLTGREAWRAKQVQGDADTRITLRRREGITPRMRVTWTIAGATRTYAIRSALETDERRREIVLLCVEQR